MAYVLLSLGSNVEREKHLQACVNALKAQFEVSAISSVYESEAVGFEGDNFYNMAVALDTQLTVGQLQQQLQKIEDDNGRVRQGARFSSRTLDIDILTYDQLTGDVDGVDLPRAEILDNAFVLWPMAEIAADKLHPVLNKSYADLWQAYQETQAIWVADIRFQ